MCLGLGELLVGGRCWNEREGSDTGGEGSESGGVRGGVPFMLMLSPK